MFARDPIPGRVKTRLIPAIGELGATQLYRRMLRDTLQVAASTPCERRELWVDRLNPNSPLIQLAQAHSLKLKRQVGADLGERMRYALAGALRDSDAVVLIGSDCPEYHTAYLEAAFAALTHHPVVIGPATDGGYVLIGLRQTQPALFSEMPWGSDQVLNETRRRLQVLGLAWSELASLHDLDEPDDLAYFAHLLAAAGVPPRPDD